ncbi:LysM peptidoglycan-binding domain-containing protein [Ectothiorhodospiraceae bacterium BW-2]|nr:LysM peptidoglycan-binding domain-containing protein [Ectothiorhodospiraceae bacterium BW-2]
MQYTTLGRQLLLATLVSVVAVGCSSTQEIEEKPIVVVNTPEPMPAPEPEPVVEVQTAPVVESTVVPNGSYEVARGDSLWRISAKSAIYGNPYHWPMIYKTNRHQIKDADLIYPGQVLEIERNATTSQMEAAVAHARHRGAWSLGEIEESDRRYLVE